MNRVTLRTLVGALATGLAWSISPAAEEEADPFMAKPMAELSQTVVSGDAEIDRIHAAETIGKLLEKPEQPKGKKKGAKRAEEAAPARQLTPDDRKLALTAAATGIGDSSGAVRHYSQKVLASLGEDAIPLVNAALTDANIDKVQAAALAVDDMGGKGKRNDPLPAGVDVVVPALIKALQHDSYVVREAAAMACRGLGTVAAPALPQLIALLQEDEFSVANAAVHAVAAADPSGKESVPALVAALDSKHDLREFICVELGEMGQNAADAVPALAKLVDTDRNNWHAGNAACKALMKIVAYDPKGNEGNPVEDKCAKVRPLAIAAIVEGALNHETHFCRWDRLNSLYMKPSLYCPFGDEIQPLIPKVLADLREYMPMTQTKYWPPREETCDLAVRIGLSDEMERAKIVALVKELLRDGTTEKSGVAQLEKMLNALEG